MLGTERKSLEIENEVINWDELKLHMLKTLLLYKRMDYIYLDKKSRNAEYNSASALH